MVYIFGIDMPLIELLFTFAVGSIIILTGLIYIIVKAAVINRKMNKLLSKEREDLRLLETEIARQAEDLGRLEHALKIKPALAVKIPKEEAVEKLRHEAMIEEKRYPAEKERVSVAKPTAGWFARRAESASARRAERAEKIAEKRRIKELERRVAGLEKEKEIPIEREVEERVERVKPGLIETWARGRQRRKLEIMRKAELERAERLLAQATMVEGEIKKMKEMGIDTETEEAELKKLKTKVESAVR